jgi:hypothetical protein
VSDLPLYQIVGYNDYFENNRSRERNICSFVCVPNKHGGQGLTALLNSGPVEGQAIYGTWMLMLQYCSRQRAPREGYLTTDGKKDGGRLCEAELARMFKTTAWHVHRVIVVLRSVGWVQLVEGKPESTVPDPLTNYAGTETGTEAGTKSVLNEDTERKKERMNESLSKDENEEPESESDKLINGFLPKVTAKAGIEAGTNGALSADWIEVSELRVLAGKLSEDVFGEAISDVQWRNQFEPYAKEACPLKREKWQLIDWAYRLPRNHKLLEVTRLRQSMLTLFQHLNSESQKIRQARAAIGLSGGLNELSDRKADADRDLAPEEIAATRKIYGPDAPLPKKWGQLSGSVQAEIAAALVPPDGWSVERKQAAYDEFGEDVTFTTPFDKLPVEYQRRIDERIEKETAE